MVGLLIGVAALGGGFVGARNFVRRRLRLCVQRRLHALQHEREGRLREEEPPPPEPPRPRRAGSSSY